MTLLSLKSRILIFIKSAGCSECLESRMEGVLLWQSWVSSGSLFSSTLDILSSSFCQESTLFGRYLLSHKCVSIKTIFVIC